MSDKNDLLRRQDCINAIEEITSSMSVCVNADERHGMKRMQRQAVLEIANMPAVQPEIIQCKDCKHRDKYGCCKYWKGLTMGDIPIATDDYDFCSYAKRI